MADETPRFGLSVYELGDLNWDHTDTIETVDENLIETGFIENRPSEGKYDNELYAAVDQRILWRWDSDMNDWEPLSGLGDNSTPVPNETYFESVHARKLNNVLWAETPDEIGEKLDELPEQGGVVKLVPGVYSDPDWTKTITIPTGTPGRSSWCIDMTGSRILLSEFSGPYIERPGPNPTSDNDRINIQGPANFNVNTVSDPGVVMKLWDTQAERVYWPSCFGNVDAIIEVRSSEGSGHWGDFYVRGSHVDKGVIIGHPDDPQTKDRAIWRGQIGNIRDIGVHVRKGQAHHFFVQPEGGEGPEIATGYKVEYGGNTIYNWHNGDYIKPLDIESPYNILRPIGRIKLKGDDSTEFNVAVPPRNIIGGRGMTYCNRFVENKLDAFDITTEGDGDAFIHDGFSQLRLSVRNAGDLSRFRTHTGIGPESDGSVIAFEISPESISNQRIRVGLTDSGDIAWNSSAIYLEADSQQGTTTPNWRFITRDTDGSIVQDNNTGISFEDEFGQEIIFNYHNKYQCAYINYEFGGDSTTSYPNYDMWKMTPTVELINYDDGGELSRVNLLSLEAYYTKEESFNLEGGLK